MALFLPALIALKRHPKAVADPAYMGKFAAMHPTNHGGAMDIFKFRYLGRGQKFLHTSSIANPKSVVNELLVELVAFDEETSLWLICYNGNKREGSGRTDGYHLRNKMLLTLKQSLSFGVCTSLLLDSGRKEVFIASVRPKLKYVWK